MFTSTGLFKEIPCPNDSECLLVNCVFYHSTSNVNNPANGHDFYDPLTAGERLSPPPQKKRRIEKEEKLEDGPTYSQIKVEPPDTADAEKGLLVTKLSQPRIAEQPASRPTPISASRPVSPPPVRGTKTVVPSSQKHLGVKVETTQAPGKVAERPKESLNPRAIAKPPQTNPRRKAVLTGLHAALKKLNEQMSAKGGSNKESVLSEDELILMANDEEEQMALKSTDENIYRSITGQRVMKLRKMDLVEWKGLVLGTFRQTNLPPEALKQAKKAEKIALSTELTTDEEIAVLRYLRTPLEGLETHGYVTKAPSELDIENARAGLETSAGFEMCDRCKTRFQVFPGRDEQGRLTSRGPCSYHYAKLPFRAAADATYGCCQRKPGSEGCQITETHVFKVSGGKRLASIWQYKATPELEGDAPAKAVAIDCEMGYTTLGMEMIRLSAVSWPQGQELLDILVRPKGEILDLNTRFSGVSKDQFNKAIPYGAKPNDHSESKSEDGKLKPESIRKVNSPEVARKLLFELIGPDTPLIGHAIDNDLDVCRIIHPFVIDTVLLYPHPRGLPIRYGLRMLTSKYLDRNIQIDGTGHDSVEDARATGELVRIKVADKWKEMRRDGWAFEDGVLTLPDEALAKKPPPRPRATQPNAL